MEGVKGSGARGFGLQVVTLLLSQFGKGSKVPTVYSRMYGFYASKYYHDLGKYPP